MLAKNLTFLAHADAAGIVLGARVPIILTSRADSVRTRLASCAVASLYADARRRSKPRWPPESAWTSILVVNAGSSSLKFQIFGIAADSLKRLVRGQIDGIGAQAAPAAERRDGVDPGRSRPIPRTMSRPAGRHRRARRLAASRSRLRPCAHRPSRRARRSGFTTGRC